MDINTLLASLETGGLFVFAVTVWWELKEMRKMVTDSIDRFTTAAQESNVTLARLDAHFNRAP